jgi:hypothetical protein
MTTVSQYKWLPLICYKVEPASVMQIPLLERPVPLYATTERQTGGRLEKRSPVADIPSQMLPQPISHQPKHQLEMQPA